MGVYTNFIPGTNIFWQTNTNLLWYNNIEEGTNNLLAFTNSVALTNNFVPALTNKVWLMSPNSRWDMYLLLDNRVPAITPNHPMTVEDWQRLVQAVPPRN